MIRKILAFFSLAAVLASLLYYIKICGMTLLELSAVSPATYLLAAAFLLFFLGAGFLRSLLVPCLLYYGITGLFLYPWNGFDASAQAMHILILADAVYFVVAAVLRFQLIRMAAGLVLGIALVVGVRLNQIRLLCAKPALASKYLPKNLRPASKVKKLRKKGEKIIKKTGAVKKELKHIK